MSGVERVFCLRLGAGSLTFYTIDAETGISIWRVGSGQEMRRLEESVFRCLFPRQRMLANELAGARFGIGRFKGSRITPTVYFRDKQLETRTISDRKSMRL
jgi:hypothetical protein